MILYHGSNVAIDKIDLNLCKPYKDFGRGFYLTDIQSQAEDMAIRRVKLADWGSPIVTAYEFDERLLNDKSINVLVFPSVSVKWAEFVLKNRDVNREGFKHDYDVVVGPVANDTVAFQLRRYLFGAITLESLVKELEFKGRNRQFFFGTEIAISKLKRL
ncbi:MAG: DUF3990 domain-containing protein [Prevotella sp.]|nr:DUF3990 domain-containing protein [Prevotella sp.]